MTSLIRGCLLTGVIVSVAISLVQSRELRAAKAVRPFASLMPGNDAPVLQVLDSAGRMDRVRFDDFGGLTVLYFTSPSCEVCVQNSDSVALLAKARGARLIAVVPTVSGITLMPKQTFRVVSGIQPAMSFTYRLETLPQTVVVSSAGKVVKNWPGVYAGIIREEISEFFDVKLPEFGK